MGRFQQLRAKALSLRGAVALGGALVMAASMTQVAGTLAAPDEVREAKAGIATQNYYPTPLASDISCSNAGLWGSYRANVSWTAPEPTPGTAPNYYRYRVDWVDGSGNVRHSFETSSTTTGNFRIRDNLGAGDSINNSYRIRVHTISMEDGAVVSSGYRSHTVHSAIATNTYCSGGPFPGSDAPNQAWENQYDWDAGVIPFGAGPSPSIFGGQFDAGAAEEHLESLPENDELTSLDEATSEVAPTASETATSSRRSTPSSPTPPSSTTSEFATTSAVPRATEPSTSVPTTTSSPTRMTSSAVTSPPSSTPTAPPSMRARVGDDPIAVGTSQARLEVVDGETQLIVTRSGSEVCTAEVSSASWIESTEGALTVTISGRTMPVDLETCDLT